MKKMVTPSDSTSNPLVIKTTSISSTTNHRYHHDWMDHHNHSGHHPLTKNGSSPSMTTTVSMMISHYYTWGDAYPRRKWWCCHCQCRSKCCQHQARPMVSTHHHHPPPTTASSSHSHRRCSKVRTLLYILFILLLFGVVLTTDYHLNHYMKMISQTISYMSTDSDMDSASTSPLNDKTLQWDDEQFPHVWLSYEKQQQEFQTTASSSSSKPNNWTNLMIPKPPYMILLTEYGWNHPDQNHGLTFARSIRSTEYIQSIVNHKYFHPTAYREIMITQNRTVDPDMTYYVFLDIETCYETNYPYYRKSYSGNCDRTGHRSYYTYTYIKYRHPPTAACYNFDHPDCHHIPTEISTNPIFTTTTASGTTTTTASRNSKLIVFDCRGNGQNVLFRNGPAGNSTSLALVSLSSTAQQLNLAIDQGLPPPTIKKVPYRTTITPTKSSSSSRSQFDHEINCNCTSFLQKDHTSTSNDHAKSRKYLLSFSGDYKRHPIRQELVKLDTVRSNMIAKNISATTTTPMTRETQEQSLVLITDSKELYQYTNGLSYTELLLSSQYVAVPRGDNLFSYRFSEVLSSGAIPVLIHNSAWILPFRPEIVQWDQCVIRISADQINTTVSILQNIPPYEQCQRRKYCFHIYETYMMNSSATIQGILDGLQAITAVQ